MKCSFTAVLLSVIVIITGCAHTKPSASTTSTVNTSYDTMFNGERHQMSITEIDNVPIETGRQFVSAQPGFHIIKITDRADNTPTRQISMNVCFEPGKVFELRSFHADLAIMKSVMAWRDR